MNVFRFALTGLVVAGLLAPHAMAETPNKPVTVIELFTSQSCYSCPPAEAYLGELAQRDDIVALEYHVDYWNRINYGIHGRWVDEFSTPEMTARQRAYNLAIRNTGGVYTPQMVIDGRAEAVGSRRGEVQGLVRKVRADDAPRIRVSVSAGADGGISIALPDGPDDGADIWLVTFIHEHTTQVVRGENHGKTLTGHNIVRKVTRVGEWRGDAATLSVAKDALGLEPGQGCAILVQDERPGPVLGASYCPDNAGMAS